MSTTPKNCKCTNVAHGHGIPCGQSATEADELCNYCSKAESVLSEVGPNKYLFNVLKTYPISNVASQNVIDGNIYWNYLLSSEPATYHPDPEKVRSLENEIRTLQDNLKTMAGDLQKEKVTAAGHQEREAQLNATLSELTKKQQLAFLLDRISPDAANVLLRSEKLRDEFMSSSSRSLFAMSVDIRRSTDLMLKARSPQDFAKFITKLCNDLMDVVRNNHGVVDKFTGDGILCFFPEFFTGKDAGYYALSAADACHAIFSRHYRAHRNSFTSVLKDVGLGIGIDYGECHLVQVAGNLTIVGAPVVYACRLGGAPAGKTLLNQPAYEVISARHGGYVFLEETSIEIKHEGEIAAYGAALSRATYNPASPGWATLEDAGSTAAEQAASKNAAAKRYKREIG